MRSNGSLSLLSLPSRRLPSPPTAHLRARAHIAAPPPPALRRWASIDTSRYSYAPPVLSRHSGRRIVHDPIYNKGTGFPYPERDALRIRGLVPPRMLALETQAQKGAF